MQYDFTSIIERNGLDAIAVDMIGDGGGFAPDAPKPGFDVIPMWVADMNFPVVPTIQEAMIRRAQHPTFGYFSPRQEYFDAIIRWQTAHNGAVGLKPEHIGYENGVLGGVVTAMNILCSRGDKVLVHAPTYIGFTSCLENNGYHIVHSDLVRDAQGIWRMDFADMERKIVENKIHVTVFCTPHNPTGRVWEHWEVEQAMELFRKHDVMVISDEIWSDIILPGHTHIPPQRISEDARNRTIALYAPSKTFNLAGLVGSYHIIYNKTLRERHNKEASLSHYNSMNVMSMYALIGAYGPEGSHWVQELCQVIRDNVRYACDHINAHYPDIRVTAPEGTYMLYLDCSAWCEKQGKSVAELLKAGWDVGVAWQDGRPFHGAHHIRMNLALPLSRVQEAFRRLDEYVFG